MEETQYISYLLRLWPVKTEVGMTWRASLESSLSGDRTGFADLETLFLFIEQSLQNINFNEPAQNEKDVE